jgi:hypothetical protein
MGSQLNCPSDDFRLIPMVNQVQQKKLIHCSTYLSAFLLGMESSRNVVESSVSNPAYFAVAADGTDTIAESPTTPS